RSTRPRAVRAGWLGEMDVWLGVPWHLRRLSARDHALSRPHGPRAPATPNAGRPGPREGTEPEDHSGPRKPLVRFHGRDSGARPSVRLVAPAIARRHCRRRTRAPRVP